MMVSNKMVRVFALAGAAAAVVFGCVELARAVPAVSAAPPVTVQPGVGTGKLCPAADPFQAEREACALAAREMDAKGIFVYDCDAGELLYCAGQPDQALYPASVTKLFTAWVALQYLPPEEKVTVGDELSLVRPGSSTAFLARGQILTVEMLVEAMLLPSGNDAAYALAAAGGRAVAGDGTLSAEKAVERFVEEMNRQAALLGASHTTFANPDGYHRETHVSTPADLGKLGAVALEEPMIGKYSTLAVDSVRFASGETITWYNTNRLVSPGDIYYTPSVTGGKTGYTRQAGYCLLAQFRQGARKLIIGVFGTGDRADRYRCARKLLEVFAQEKS